MINFIKNLFRKFKGGIMKNKITFDDKKLELENIVRTCFVLDEYEIEAMKAAQRAIQNKGVYSKIVEGFKIPWEAVAAIHYMEASQDFSKCLHNGQRWDRVTTIVPKGKGPFNSFEAAAIDALNYDGLTKIEDWSDSHMCWVLENYNGAGYRNKGLLSPYVFGGLNVHPNKGLYVSDGNFDPDAKIKRPGCYAIIKMIRQLDNTSEF